MPALSSRGMTLIDVVVGSAILLLVFLGIFGILRAALLTSSVAKAKAGATAVASSQMEYVRSLSYNAIGTSGGIPSGTIPQNATTTLNGIEYGLRTFIIYVDDPADGEGGADSNGITADYKRIKVEVTYTIQGGTREISMVSNHAPPGVESTAGGGTLRLEVVDAEGLPVSGATVRVANAVLIPAVDVSTFSDVTGTVLFSGAATSTEYEVYVSKAGYSSTQTYERDGTNQSPTPGYLTVAEAQTTTSTFAIDYLGTLTLRTFSPPALASFEDTFGDASQLYSLSNTQVAGGEVLLTGAPGTYAASGDAISATTTPAGISNWTQVEATLAIPANTSALVQVVDESGSPLGDAALPGNSAGFATSPIDLSGVSTTTYPSLGLKAVLTSSDPLVTSSVTDWELSYTTAKTPLPDVPFTLVGGKTIGSTVLGDPIYKTTVSTTTDATGERVLSLEWDLYQLTLSGGYTLQSATPEAPFELVPGGTFDAELIVSPP